MNPELHMNLFYSAIGIGGFVAYMLIAEPAAHLYLWVMDYLFGDDDSGSEVGR
jgi:hypothetical protein